MNPANVSRLTWPIVAALGLILAAFVAVVVTGHDPGGFITVLTMVLASAGLLAHQSVRLSAQDQQLQQIEHQTNGAMDARIEAAIAKALSLREAQHSAAAEVAQRILEQRDQPEDQPPAHQPRRKPKP